MQQDDSIDFREIKSLIIDDSRHMRLLVKSILLQLGCQDVREASDAAAVFKEMQHYPADLAIVDYAMEPLDGLDFVRLVRTASDSRNQMLPIIMLSGYTEARRIAEARDAGVNEFLAKPVSIEAMKRRMIAIFKNPRPFIRSQHFVGPCRRRANHGPPPGMRERRAEAVVSV